MTDSTAGAHGAQPRARFALLFRSGARTCALPVEHVVETMRPLPIEPVPDAPPFVSGVALVRGVPTPVLDVARLLDAPPEPVGRLVTVRAGAGRAVALAVNEVIGVRPLPAGQGLPPLLAHAPAAGVAAIASLDQELLFVLEATRLIGGPGAALGERSG